MKGFLEKDILYLYTAATTRVVENSIMIFPQFSTRWHMARRNTTICPEYTLSYVSCSVISSLCLSACVCVECLLVRLQFSTTSPEVCSGRLMRATTYSCLPDCFGSNWLAFWHTDWLDCSPLHTLSVFWLSMVCISCGLCFLCPNAHVS